MNLVFPNRGGSLAFEDNTSEGAVSVTQINSYRIRATPTLTSVAATTELMDAANRHRAARLVVVVDRTVWSLHRAELIRALSVTGLPWIRFDLEPGESSKSIQVAVSLWSTFKRSGVNRRDLICAIGGGVVCDTVGFCAATYLRGVPYLLIPTTLMAQIDAGIGGKVGVDFEGSKNWIGAFYHPDAVLMCADLMATLPISEVANGCAELIKVAALDTMEWWSELVCDFRGEPDLNLDLVGRHTWRAVCVKNRLLANDPTEWLDLDRCLNFGHCIGHAIEAASSFELRHGESVALGMVMASVIGHRRGAVDTEFLHQLIDILRRCGLQTKLASALSTRPRAERAAFENAVWANLSDLRKVRNGRLRMAVVRRPGLVTFFDDISKDEFVLASKVMAEL